MNNQTIKVFNKLIKQFNIDEKTFYSATMNRRGIALQGDYNERTFKFVKNINIDLTQDTRGWFEGFIIIDEVQINICLTLAS